jgi:hypothetical protein
MKVMHILEQEGPEGIAGLKYKGSMEDKSIKFHKLKKINEISLKLT